MSPFFLLGRATFAFARAFTPTLRALTTVVLLVVTKKSAAPVKQEKKRVAVPVASRPVVVEKVAVREEIVKPAADSRPRTPLQAVGRSSATES